MFYWSFASRMWMWRSFMCVSMVCGLALDSNTIRSSREMAGQSSELLDRSHSDQVERSARRRIDANSSSHRESASSCSSPDCFASQSNECSNRAQRRPPGQAEREGEAEVDQRSNTDGFNRTKAPEMSSCVRSGDCAAGLCCVRYLTGKRCQRIPVEGEACLLRSFNKQRRKLGRCDCDVGLSCSAVNRSESGKNKGQGVCRPRHGQRPAGHSGKKRRTAESSC